MTSKGSNPRNNFFFLGMFQFVDMNHLLMNSSIVTLPRLLLLLLIQQISTSPTESVISTFSSGPDLDLDGNVIVGRYRPKKVPNCQRNDNVSLVSHVLKELENESNAINSNDDSPELIQRKENDVISVAISLNDSESEEDSRKHQDSEHLSAEEKNEKDILQDFVEWDYAKEDSVEESLNEKEIFTQHIQQQCAPEMNDFVESDSGDFGAVFHEDSSNEENQQKKKNMKKRKKKEKKDSTNSVRNFDDDQVTIIKKKSHRTIRNKRNVQSNEDIDLSHSNAFNNTLSIKRVKEMKTKPVVLDDDEDSKKKQILVKHTGRPQLKSTKSRLEVYQGTIITSQFTGISKQWETLELSSVFFQIIYFFQINFIYLYVTVCDKGDEKEKKLMVQFPSYDVLQIAFSLERIENMFHMDQVTSEANTGKHIKRTVAFTHHAASILLDLSNTSPLFPPHYQAASTGNRRVCKNVIWFSFWCRAPNCGHLVKSTESELTLEYFEKAMTMKAIIDRKELTESYRKRQKMIEEGVECVGISKINITYYFLTRCCHPAEGLYFTFICSLNNLISFFFFFFKKRI